MWEFHFDTPVEHLEVTDQGYRVICGTRSLRV